MKKKRKKLKEYTGPSFYGNPTFQGGPLGIGGDKQLAKKNAQVKKIKDQEDAEYNQNAQNLEYIGSINERTPSDAFAPAPHLPGNRPAGSIENPQHYIPKEDPELMDAGKPVEYADPYNLDDLINELLGVEDVFAYKDAPELPVGGMGVVMQPKGFVPDEYPQSSKFKDSDFDGMPDHVDPNLPSELRMRTKINENFIEKIVKKVMEKIK